MERVRDVFIGTLVFVLEYLPQMVDTWSLKVSHLCVVFVLALQLYPPANKKSFTWSSSVDGDLF